MLERMGDFFDNRLEGYDEHQLSRIDSAREFIAFTAQCLPSFRNVQFWIWDVAQGWNWNSIFQSTHPL